MDLIIPFDLAPAAPELEIRPRHVKRWIESLQLHVTFESGRALLKHLAAINRARLDAGARQEILEAHRQAAAQVLQDLEAMYATAPLPLGPGPRAALGLARELWTELALGYRVAIVDSGGKLFSSKKQLTALLHRATQCTAGRLLAAYKSYTPVPTGTWAQLHELFLKADALGVASHDAEGEASIADLYREALLLSLTDPYRLRRDEAGRVMQLLHAHRGLATLGQARPRTPPAGHFIVPCNVDKPPKPSIGKLDDTGGPDWRLLDANPLVERLRAQREAPDAGRTTATKRPDNSRAELVAKLVTLWGDPPKRTSRRDPGEASVAISMGIDGVGHFVSLEAGLDLERQDEMLRRGITMPLAPLPLDSQSEPIPVFEWDVVNQSNGGLRVRRAGRTEQPIAVGEVAGIKLAGKPHWAIGAVRWVTVFEDGGMEFGLQYLAPMARAVTVSAWGAPSGTGLLLHGEGPTSLLTSPNAFSHLRELEIEDQGDACLVRPSNVVEVTPRFERFTVETD
jgi:hypothetical protein